MDGYKISSELFLFLLANLPSPRLIHKPDLYRLVFDDEVLIKEIVLWGDNVRNGMLIVKSQKVDIGPFLGVFPILLEFSETSSARTATVEFSIDFYSTGRGITWKDWFILEEDKRGKCSYLYRSSLVKEEE